METILRVFQFFLALGLIGVVLLQRSEGGGLGIGSSGGSGSFMSVRGAANFLTRTTSILAALFMATCLALTLMAKPGAANKSIFDAPVAPVSGTQIPVAPAPVGPATDTGPAPQAPAAPVTTQQMTPPAKDPAPAPKAPDSK